MAGDNLLWSQISLFGYGCFLGLVGVSDHVLGWHAAEYEAAGMIFSAVKCPSRCPMKSSLSNHEINRCIGAGLASTGLRHLCWWTYISDSKNKVADKSSWNDVPSGLALICFEGSQLRYCKHLSMMLLEQISVEVFSMRPIGKRCWASLEYVERYYYIYPSWPGIWHLKCLICVENLTFCGFLSTDSGMRTTKC